MYFIISREEGLRVGDLAHDAGDGPEVDAFVVGSLAEEQFRSPVPPCCDIIRQIIISLGPLSGETKITKF